ncbi:hypothetical protein [Kineosporia sp. A_224]|uniref:hypothetical protein n=1 Tax=Kineosporia sp. A_224 TaxID=1962180 RepID=UPI000B4B9CE3|nr:hypothetical protein [Kineosporia sp. A_224]
MSATAVRPAADVPPSARVALALRLPVLAAVAATLGTAGHVLVEHEVPPPRLLAVGLVLVALCGLPARRREVSGAGVTVMLLAGQAVLHLVLCLCHCVPGRAFTTFVHAVLCPGRADAAARAWATDPLLVSRPDAGYAAHVYPGHAMLLAHLLAAVAAAWWLRRGEAAVWAALRAVRPALRLAVPTPLVPAVRQRPRVRPRTAVAVLCDQVLATAAHPRRGPPLAV